MLKTLEVLFVVALVFTSLYAVQSFVQLPSPRLSSSVGQKELAASTLKSLDNDGSLTRAAFSSGGNWPPEILRSIESSLPPNTIYRLVAYQINNNTNSLQYNLTKTGPENVGVFPSGSITTSYTVTSPDVTVTKTPEKIRIGNNSITLYILNCADSNGWWITGYTGQTLAKDVYQTMSPYFEKTVLVNTTDLLDKLLSGLPITTDPKEHVKNAVIINTFGESVPIPASKALAYQTDLNQYPYLVGKKTLQYNYTWVSIVGYPFYYVSNTNQFTGSSDNNGWGIYGMKCLGSTGLNAFLQGIDNRTYTSPTSGSKNPTANSGPWTSPTYAYSKDSQPAYTTTNNRAQVYSGYGLSSAITDGTHINVHVCAWASTSGQKTKVEVSDGTAWYTVTTQDLTTSETQYDYDVTSLLHWTPTKLSNLQTRVTSVSTGGAQINLDWIGVETTSWITGSIGVLTYTNPLKENMNYYGIYPGTDQTATRSLSRVDLNNYNMIDYADIFTPENVGGNVYCAGATWVHTASGHPRGAFMAIGLARTPDIRVSLIGLLAYYHPSILRTEFRASSTTRLVELQIGQMGAG